MNTLKFFSLALVAVLLALAGANSFSLTSGLNASPNVESQSVQGAHAATAGAQTNSTQNVQVKDLAQGVDNKQSSGRYLGTVNGYEQQQYVAPQAPTYEQPAPSYSPPAQSYSPPSYTPPTPSYSPPAPSYSPPSYTPPAPSYSPPTYSPPAQTYTPPVQTYTPPATTYEQPMTQTYQAPSYSNYSAPSYTPPAQSYSPPSYTPPAPSYTPPTPSYTPPSYSPPSYSPPAMNYSTPSYSAPSYTPPAQTYTPPTQSYSQPSYTPPSYTPPPTPTYSNYSTPSYTPPAQSYSPPSYTPPTYSPPAMNYSTPSYSAPSYTPPSYTPPSYSPPSYSPPAMNYSTPSYSAPTYEVQNYTQSYAPPAQTYSPPAQTYSPPAQTYTPPVQSYTPPVQSYTPPTPSYPQPSYSNYSAPTYTATIVESYQPQSYQQPSYQQQSYQQPSYQQQSYQPPAQTYTPPMQSYTPPAPSYTPPAPSYTPPAPSYTPPAPSYTPPAPSYSPPVYQQQSYQQSYSGTYSEGPSMIYKRQLTSDYSAETPANMTSSLSSSSSTSSSELKNSQGGDLTFDIATSDSMAMPVYAKPQPVYTPPQPQPIYNKQPVYNMQPVHQYLDTQPEFTQAWADFYHPPGYLPLAFRTIYVPPQYNKQLPYAGNQTAYTPQSIGIGYIHWSGPINPASIYVPVQLPYYYKSPPQSPSFSPRPPTYQHQLPLHPHKGYGKRSLTGHEFAPYQLLVDHLAAAASDVKEAFANVSTIECPTRPSDYTCPKVLTSANKEELKKKLCEYETILSGTVALVPDTEKAQTRCGAMQIRNTLVKSDDEAQFANKMAIVLGKDCDLKSIISCDNKSSSKQPQQHEKEFHMLIKAEIPENTKFILADGTNMDLISASVLSKDEITSAFKQCPRKA